MKDDLEGMSLEDALAAAGIWTQPLKGGPVGWLIAAVDARQLSTREKADLLEYVSGSPGAADLEDEDAAVDAVERAEREFRASKL